MLVLTTNEHIDYLASNNRINRNAAICVLKQMAKNTGLDMDKLEPVSYAVTITVMSAVHRSYPDIYDIIAKNKDRDCTQELKRKLENEIYHEVKAAVDGKYMPESSKPSWVAIMLYYVDTYEEILTGVKRVNSTSLF